LDLRVRFIVGSSTFAGSGKSDFFVALGYGDFARPRFCGVSFLSSSFELLEVELNADFSLISGVGIASAFFFETARFGFSTSFLTSGSDSTFVFFKTFCFLGDSSLFLVLSTFELKIAIGVYKNAGGLMPTCCK